MKIKKLLALLCAAMLLLSAFVSRADEIAETAAAQPEITEKAEEAPQPEVKEKAEEAPQPPAEEKIEPTEAQNELSAQPQNEPQQEQPQEQQEQPQSEQQTEPTVEPTAEPTTEPTAEPTAAPQEQGDTPSETKVFTVRFVDTLFDEKGVLIGSVQQVEAGRDAAAPDENGAGFPTHAGYFFTGWDKSFKNVQQDLTVAAQWQKDKYTVTFYDNCTGTPAQIKSVAVEYGASVTEKPEAPQHAGFLFTGERIEGEGDSSLAYVTSDLSVYYEYTAESEQNAALGKTTIPTVRPGDTVTLVYPVTVYAGKESYPSNVKSGSNAALEYKPSRNPLEYAQSLVAEDGCGIVSFTLEIDTADAAALPFDAESMSKTAYLVVEADSDTVPGYAQFGIEKGAAVNLGYAVFEDMVVPKSGLENAYYTIPLIAHWETANGKAYSTALSAQIQVKGVKTGGGGGGFGGGSSTTVSPTPNPQAKLIIDSIRTEPENPSAGDKFDVILALRNTSEKLYLQNMELTYTADEDALLPVSGSNTLYIPRIAQDSTYEAVLHVRSKPDITTPDVRLNVEMSFEDNELNTLSASQTMILPVKQVQKITVDDPVLPTGTLTANSSYEVEMGVYNAGQTTLYNVTAQLVCENENFETGKRFFAGNMESGTAKTVELDFIPLTEGEFSGNIRLTYETLDGEVSEHTTPFTLYAMAEEEYDYDAFEDYSFEPLPEETAPTAADVLGRLNPMVFAFAGALLFTVIVALGVSAKNKRKRAFEEDEMD